MDNLVRQQLETVETLCDYIPRLIKGIEQARDCFQEGDESEGYALVSQILEGYEWAIEAITLTNTLHAEPIEIENIQNMIAELMEALENEDTLLVADLLEFEMSIGLSKWHKALYTTYINQSSAH